MRSGVRLSLREYALKTLSIYWPAGQTAIVSLPIPIIPFTERGAIIPPLMDLVPLPAWAMDTGVEGAILVPTELIMPGEREAWTRVDWIGAVAWYLSGLAEREFERQHGPVHSYSFRLTKWDARIWERAWVNRIALFLRRWASEQFGQKEEAVCGPLPEPRIILTHDVDAVRKTLVIRVKQGVFYLFNALRALFHGELKRFLSHLGKGLGFVFGQADYWCFDTIRSLEERYGVRSQFNFYGGARCSKKGGLSLLFDPSYDVAAPAIKKEIQNLAENGWSIGLHQSFYAWDKSLPMVEEKAALEESLGATVSTCRQHWLRFSWDKTWRAQEEAGFRRDATLGFNDRPGFRLSAALPFFPWDPQKTAALTIQAVPMVLMDSHLYDYGDLSPEERKRQTTTWIDEIKSVHGTATIIWHQRVMSRDYDWGPGYEELLQILRDL